jgi:hypothetical protein
MKLMLMMCALTLLSASSAEVIQKQSVTELSKKAARLKRGMTRAEVIGLLGTPTWVRLPTDRREDALEAGQTLELHWANGNCNPVAVVFNSKGVSGWDEGRALCLDKPYPYVPADKVSCKQKERAKYCR